MTFWAKDISGFQVKKRSLEPPLHEQLEYLTPNDRFFVCNSGTTPSIDSQSYTLTVRGDSIARDLTLSLADLQAMPQRTVPAVIECAGNHRALFEDVMGQPLNKRPHMTELKWALGGVGMAEWRGVPLKTILELAGVMENAHQVCFSGSETDSPEGLVRVPIPLAKAMDDDTIIALEMNGEQLPPDHGFPARAVVPGWVGTYSVKWLSDIEISRNPFWVVRNTERYIMMGDLWPAETYAPANGELITEQNLKSSLALPWPAHVSPGAHIVTGFARAPSTPISKVEWSDNGGEHWSEAQLVGPNEKYGWTRFQFEWVASPGHQALMTRATDSDGNIQPETIPFNNGGYMFNAIHPHPIIVE